MTIMTQPSIELKDLLAQVDAAISQRTPLRIQGGNSKHWYGEVTQAATSVLDSSAYHGVLDYEPSELVITARCGTPLQEIENLLAQRGQMLAFEPPRFSVNSTIGGVVAAGLSGPRRATAGAVRDFVLGARLINGLGQDLRFGGTVMKNVAGYDVSRLLTGSLGTLGLISEVSVKVLPVPTQEKTLSFSLKQAQALQQLNEWAGLPLPISASSWIDGQLHVRLSGAQAAVASAQTRLGGELLDETAAQQHWQQLRDQQHDFFKQDGHLWRLSLPSTAPALSLDGTLLIEWGGAQRWLFSNAQAEQIRAVAQQLGGHATLYFAAANNLMNANTQRFTPLSANLLKIHQRLKQEFDPHGIFNPGRLIV